MGFAKDVLGFEAFNLKGIGSKLKDNPARLLYGGIDPASTKVWNALLGKDDKPLLDQWGGASPDTYTAANAAGVPTSSGKMMHDIAKVVAAVYVGRYGKDSLGVGSDNGGGGQGFPGVNMPPQQQQPQSNQAAQMAQMQLEQRRRIEQALFQQSQAQQWTT